MAAKSSKTKVSELRAGDVVKITVPVRIDQVLNTKGTFGDINDTTTLKSLSCTITDGTFHNAKALALVSGDDKVEVLSRARRSLFSRVKSYLFFFGG